MRLDNILGDGIAFLELVDSMGSDLTVVNSARVSFGKRKTELDEADVKLINFLAKNKHWSPFRHVQFQFHFKAPEMVGRQLYKHIVGSDYTFKDHAWNEISGRYVVYEDEFYIPNVLRTQSPDNRQASTDEPIDSNVTMRFLIEKHAKESYALYKDLIAAGTCKEQARLVLPVSFYTEWYWTASLQATMNMINLRDKPGAQWESRKFAIAARDLILPKLPNSIEALTKYSQ
jgi:thymidylate synthase (FAD)